MLNRCLKCFSYQGEEVVLPPQRKSMFRLELPAVETQHENIQSLVDKHFRVRDQDSKEMVPCRNENCSSQIAKFTKIELLDPKDAIVLHINRRQENPFWSDPR